MLDNLFNSGAAVARETGSLAGPRPAVAFAQLTSFEYRLKAECGTPMAIGTTVAVNMHDAAAKIIEAGLIDPDCVDLHIVAAAGPKLKYCESRFFDRALGRAVVVFLGQQPGARLIDIFEAVKSPDSLELGCTVAALLHDGHLIARATEDGGRMGYFLAGELPA